jgi:hypothetical protein
VRDLESTRDRLAMYSAVTISTGDAWTLYTADSLTSKPKFKR